MGSGLSMISPLGVKRPRRGDFFSALFNFAETDYEATQSKLMSLAAFSPAIPADLVDIPTLPVPAERCVFRLDGGARLVDAGVFYEPSIAELRGQVERALAAVDATSRGPGSRAIRLRNVVGDVSSLHRDAAYAGAVFQAASQFNYLEFMGPNVTPEKGIMGYQYDHTQGPTCAIACGAGTAYRNYLIRFDRGSGAASQQRGQTADSQCNGLADVERALMTKIEASRPHTTLTTDNFDPFQTFPSSPSRSVPWRVRNGYIDALNPDMFAEINPILERDAEELVGRLRVGVQQATAVCEGGVPVRAVTQVYCSAVSCGYSQVPLEQWAPLARLVLNGAYEATLLCGIMNNIRRARASLEAAPVVLTLVGGGVFRNDAAWIRGAIRRAVNQASVYGVPLEIHINHYGSITPGYEKLQDLL